MGLRTVVVLLVALALVAVPAGAHGNYVSADPQVSADGTVHIELVIAVADAFVVLHTDEDGDRGTPVGHREVDDFVNPDFEVALDPGYWAEQSGNVSLWVVLHGDDGDGQFEPRDDKPLTSATSDEVVADRFAVRVGTGPVNVIAEGDHAQETDRNQVTVPVARLASDGYLVVRADDDGSPGRVVGWQTLAAGNHTDVTVTIDGYFYETRPEDFALWAGIHRGDGDGQFNASSDPAVRVGDARVMTRFFVKRTDPVERTPSPTATASPTTESSGAAGGSPTGASPTQTTAEPTATQPPTAAAVQSTPTAGDCPRTTHTHDGSEVHTDCGTPTAVTVPGFGGAVAVIAVLLTSLLALRRRD